MSSAKTAVLTTSRLIFFFLVFGFFTFFCFTAGNMSLLRGAGQKFPEGEQLEAFSLLFYLCCFTQSSSLWVLLPHGPRSARSLACLAVPLGFFGGGGVQSHPLCSSVLELPGGGPWILGTRAWGGFQIFFKFLAF